MTNLSIIVAIADNGVIGVENTLPWHLPEDLKRFKTLTMGHHIIMGRKTYESLGRLLPGRTTVIVSRNKAYQVQGALVAASLSQAIAMCSSDSEPFLIGGAQMYQEGLKLANKLYLTRVNLEPEGDVFFPQIDMSLWTLLEKQDHVSSSGLVYSDLIYVKK